MPVLVDSSSELAGGQRAARVGQAVLALPGDVRFGHVALAVGADGEPLAVLVADLDQAVGEHRREADVAAAGSFARQSSLPSAGA